MENKNKDNKKIKKTNEEKTEILKLKRIYKNSVKKQKNKNL